MSSGVPVWRVLTCTYGNYDMTVILRRKLIPLLNDQKPKFSFTVSSDFFGYDPNATIPKVCVVVYQIELRSPDGKRIISPPKSASAKEGQIINLDLTQIVPNGTQAYVEPTPTTSQQYLVSAYWWTKDVTNIARRLFDNYEFVPVDKWTALRNDQSIAITVSPETLGSDPMPDWVKNFSVTYGSYVSGQWVYQAAVDAQKSTPWKLTIPTVVFPNDVGIQIHQATWGGKDITEFMRKKYQRETNALNLKFWQMSESNDAWVFTASNETFGGDPNPGVSKAFVMIFQIGHMTAEVWSTQGITTLTAGLPLTGLRTVQVREGETVSILPNKVYLSPDPYMVPPTWAMSGMPWVFKAIYSNVEITKSLQMLILEKCLPVGGGKPAVIQEPWMIDADANAFGDPWPNVQKQLTMLMGFPQSDGKWAIYKYVNIQPQGQWRISLQSPGAAIGAVTFNLTGPAVAYPKIWGADTPQPFLWSTHHNTNWTMYQNQSKTVNLVNDAGCTPGFTYYLCFDVDSMKDPDPIAARCSSDTTQTATLTLDTTKVLELVRPSVRPSTGVMFGIAGVTRPDWSDWNAPVPGL